MEDKIEKDQLSENRAVDEVRIERLKQTHGKDTLLVILRDWPKNEKYKNRPDLMASLEYLVSLYLHCITVCVIVLASNNLFNRFIDKSFY